MQRTILSTADVARLFSVTETTVKRWADDGRLKCQKTPGGHRKFDVKNVVEFADLQGFEPAGALTLPEGDSLAMTVQIGVLARDYKKLWEAFVQRALSPDKTDLYQFLSYLYQHRLAMWEIHDLVLTPAMREIGERWARGEVGINHEHRASYEVLDALAKLQAEILLKPANGLSVVCACPDEEQHQIGLRCAAYLFESEGWSVHFLGGRMPMDSIAAAVGEAKPTVLCLSVSAAYNEARLKQSLKRLSEAAAKHGAQTVIGGSGAKERYVEERLCDVVVRSSRELLDWCHEWVKHSPSRTLMTH